MGKSVLQEEIGKKHPFASLEQETTLNLYRTMDHLMQDSCRLLQEHGLSGPQYNVLRILRGHGRALSCCEIAADMLTRTPDITRLVDRLEQAGWVERQRDADGDVRRDANARAGGRAQPGVARRSGVEAVISAS